MGLLLFVGFVVCLFCVCSDVILSLFFFFRHNDLPWKYRDLVDGLRWEKERKGKERKEKKRKEKKRKEKKRKEKKRKKKKRKRERKKLRTKQTLTTILFNNKTDRVFSDTLDLWNYQPKTDTDIPRIRQGSLGAQFWSVYVSC